MKNKKYKEDSGNILKGIVAGAVGGLVASWTMEKFQALLTELSESDKKSSQKKDKKSENKKSEPATVKMAEAIAENIFDTKLTKKEKEIAGPVVHYAMGLTSGAILGAAAEVAPMTAAGAGLPFGAVVWLVADDVVVPALGLSKPPTEYPLSTHVYALSSHLVYGLTTDVVRRLVRKILD